MKEFVVGSFEVDGFCSRPVLDSMRDYFGAVYVFYGKPLSVLLFHL